MHDIREMVAIPQLCSYSSATVHMQLASYIGILMITFCLCCMYVSTFMFLRAIAIVVMNQLYQYFQTLDFVESIIIIIGLLYQCFFFVSFSQQLAIGIATTKLRITISNRKFALNLQQLQLLYACDSHVYLTLQSSCHRIYRIIHTIIYKKHNTKGMECITFTWLASQLGHLMLSKCLCMQFESSSIPLIH